MSGDPADSLPEDQRLWPNDPWKLFGLNSDQGHKVLRRAYVSLIRRFKPEHYPDHFRQIRDAFESIEWQAKINSSRDQTNELAEEPTSVLDSPIRRQSLETPSRPEPPEAVASDPPSPPNREKKDDVESQWRKALKQGGAWPDLYRQLVWEVKKGACQEELFCRLFMLLTIAPDIDLKHRPVDWLIAGMNRIVPGERLTTLYENYLNRHPLEAQELHSQRLLEQSRPLWQLTEIASYRWHALRRVQRLGDISGDLKTINPAFFDSLPQWVAILIHAVELLSWSNDKATRELRQVCKREISKLEESVGHFDHIFDRFDVLVELSKLFRQLLTSNHPKGTRVDRVLQLIPEIWIDSDTAVPLLRDEVLPWYQDIVGVLAEFDSVPTQFHPLFNYLANHFSINGPPRRYDLTESRKLAIAGVLYSVKGKKYYSNRVRLVDQCCNLGISCDELLLVAPDLPPIEKLPPSTLATFIQDDPAFRCLLAGLHFAGNAP